MNKHYYDSDFKPLRNQLRLFSKMEIANFAVNELFKSWNSDSILKYPHPWHIFNIVSWGMQFGSEKSGSAMTYKQFAKIYNYAANLRDDEALLKLFKESKTLWWPLRTIFHQQRLYQTRLSTLNCGFLLEYSDTVKGGCAEFVKMAVFLSLIFNSNNNTKSFSKSYFKGLFSDETIDMFWNVFSMKQDKLVKLSIENRENYKKVKYEKNCITSFRKFPLFINSRGMLEVFCVPLYNIFTRNGIFELLIQLKLIQKKDLEDQFEIIMTKYLKEYFPQCHKFKSGVDAIIEQNGYALFCEFKASKFHNLLPQFPTIEAHHQSLKSSVIKAYEQMLNSFRKRDKKTKNICGIIVILFDLTLGDPIDIWEHSFKNWFAGQDISDDENNFLKNNVWVLNYTEFIPVIHHTDRIEGLFKNICYAMENKDNPDLNHSFLDRYLQKGVVTGNIRLFGNRFEKYFKEIKGNFEKTHDGIIIFV